MLWQLRRVSGNLPWLVPPTPFERGNLFTFCFRAVMACQGDPDYRPTRPEAVCIGGIGGTDHVEFCTSVAYGAMGLRRIWTGSHDHLDRPGRRRCGRRHVARCVGTTSKK